MILLLTICVVSYIHAEDVVYRFAVSYFHDEGDIVIGFEVSYIQDQDIVICLAVCYIHNDHIAARHFVSLSHFELMCRTWLFCKLLLFVVIIKIRYFLSLCF